VLVLGRAKPGSAESAVVRALRRGGHAASLLDERRAAHWTGRRGANALLRARAALFRPDRVFLGKAFAVSPPALRDVVTGRRSAMWYHDLRVPILDVVVALGRVVDRLFVTAGGQVDEYRARGVSGAAYLPGAFDAHAEASAEPDPAFAADVAFVGSGYDEGRALFLRRLARRFRVRVWGPGWERWAGDLDLAGPAWGPDFARVCASARIVLGVNPSFQVRSRVWGYASNRMWRVVGCGGFYLGHATPGVRGLLRDGEHCAWYEDEEHASEQVERYLSDDAARERIRREGRAFVLAHHTFDHRVRNLLEGRAFENPLEA
jgi:spore maturation protein CgeB